MFILKIQGQHNIRKSSNRRHPMNKIEQTLLSQESRKGILQNTTLNNGKTRKR